jgi:hypothetical protein
LLAAIKVTGSSDRAPAAETTMVTAINVPNWRTGGNLDVSITMKPAATDMAFSATAMPVLDMVS